MYKQADFVQIYRAFDMGFWPDPAYCVWIAHLGSRYIAFKEKLWYRWIAPDIAKDILAESEGMKVSITFCDPTMDINTGADIRTIKDMFELNGVPMECSVNSRELYAHAVHTALAEEAEPGIPRLQILDKGHLGSTGCPYLIKTIPVQQWDPKHPLRLANHKDDHAVVALSYFLSSSAVLNRPSGGGQTPKPAKWLQRKPSERWVLGRDNVKDYLP